MGENNLSLNNIQNKNSGIYKIVNTLNNEIYIGQSKNFKHRKNTHFNNPLLLSITNYYGMNVDEIFDFSVLEYIPKNDKNRLNERESYWKDFYGITINKIKPITSKEQREKYVEKYLSSNLSRREFCNQNHLSYSSFCAWIKEYDSKLIKPYDDEYNEECKKYVDDWLSSDLLPKEYCKQNKINSTTFYQWIRKFYPNIDLKKINKEKTRERKLKILKDWVDSGLNKTDFCKQNNFQLSTINSWINEYCPKLKNYKVDKNNEKVNKILDEYVESNLIQSEFCKQYGIPKGTLRTWIDKYRPELKEYTRKKHAEEIEKQKKEHKLIIEEYISSKLSIKDFCNANNIPKGTFDKWLRKYRKGEL